MWWLLADGDSINSALVERLRVMVTGGEGQCGLVAQIGTNGYPLAGQWPDRESAAAVGLRLTNAIDASKL